MFLKYNLFIEFKIDERASRSHGRRPDNLQRARGAASVGPGAAARSPRPQGSKLRRTSRIGS